MTVAEVAAEFAYSPRQLRRLSAEWFGYGPKHLAKVLRWQAARSLIDGGRTRTEAAARAGYSDAAHLWRDERSLLGSSQGV
ncbi:MAG: helix-turn-helix domain-containing protein [Brevibacterium sp.]